MSTAGLNQFWEFIGGVFRFEVEVFQQISTLPNGLTLALFVVLTAGLSLEVGQSIVLFINRVKPIRFIFSLLISTLLYAFGYLFLVFSTWLICLVPWSVYVPFSTLVRVFGLSYAPLLFGFLGALPYLGVPILSILSVWHLLAMVVSFTAVAKVSIGAAFEYVTFGWVVLQVLQQTIGQPIANLGRWLANMVAGVQLVTRQEDLAEILRSGLNQPSSPLVNPSQRIVPNAQQLIQSARQTVEEVAANGEAQGAGLTVQVPTETASLTPVSATELSSIAAEPSSLLQKGTSGRQQRLIRVLGLLGIAILTFLVALLLDPLRDVLLGGYDRLPRSIQLGLNLAWIGIVAIAVAGLLAPLETLGWWAGWYDDEVDTTINTGTLAEPVADLSAISRYVIYLDGIGQSTSKYLPDVEGFLEALIPTLPNSNEYNLGSTLEDAPLRNLRTGLGSWRTLLPRLASDTIVRIFLEHNASVWVLRTNQIGGFDPDIEPIAPMTL